jgi:hypothetical protein
MKMWYAGQEEPRLLIEPRALSVANTATLPLRQIAHSDLMRET